ncbi:hypothetical protein ACFSZT_16295 [Prauserella oleivorans]
MVVRLRRGLVGESRRVCHVVPVPSEPVPDELVAYCGARILPGQADLLSHLTGMPCDSCLAMTVRPGRAGLAAAF